MQKIIARAVSVAIDSTDVLVEGRDRLVQRLEQRIGQNRPLHLPLQPLNQVQTLALGSQPLVRPQA